MHPEAYNAYLRGLDLKKERLTSLDKLKLSAEMFERAVQLDPKFDLGYVELSMAHTAYHLTFLDHTPERLAKAKAAIDRALELHPGLPEAHIALGYYYRAFMDFEAALKEFDMAKKHLPNNSDLIENYGQVFRRQGKFEAALSEFKKSLDLSPRDAERAFLIGQTCVPLRRYAEAEKYFNQAIALKPDWSHAYVMKGWLYLAWKGEVKKARSILAEMPQKDYPTMLWTYISLYERDFEEAFRQTSSMTDRDFREKNDDAPKSLITGFIYRYMNRPLLARKSLDAARILLEREAKAQAENPFLHAHLGLAYAALGSEQEAIREGKLALQIRPMAKDPWTGVLFVRFLAEIYSVVGKYDAALDQIEHLLSIPSWVSVWDLKLNPI